MQKGFFSPDAVCDTARAKKFLEKKKDMNFDKFIPLLIFFSVCAKGGSPLLFLPDFHIINNELCFVIVVKCDFIGQF
ncbi:MAG: hypothetical protein MJ120_06370, partial [Clostridia bacterium]|nr:hypothetical protein [Clostridia bacterium]